MISEIATALTTLKTAKDFTKAVIESKTSAALREQAITFQFSIIEIQTALMEMQSQYQSLLQEKDDLKQQLIDIENWQAESANYELKEVSSGAFAFALKADKSGSAPSHWLCANCYQNKQKGILQRVGHIGPMGTMYLCPRCDAKIFVR